MLAHCRRTGTWIVADEVYERMYFARTATRRRAVPGHRRPEDRLVVVHSFSKSFLMTGWRLGWLVLPPGPGRRRASCWNSTVPARRCSCSAAAGGAGAGPTKPCPVSWQRLQGLPRPAGAGLQALPGVTVAEPAGRLYAFFRVEGEDDSLAFAKRLVARARPRAWRPAWPSGRGRRLVALVLRLAATRRGWTRACSAAGAALRL
jgi:aspartate/methionine/tyrosine aminotransferase